ncbi:MAG: response regulator [Candidatus Saccharibacteria bacterium]
MNKTSLKVLSLEDSVLDYEILTEKLTNAYMALDIRRVENEQELVSSLKDDTYDIILADYNLPGFDGLQALVICNELCPHIPFICVSGSIGEIKAIELLKQGAVDYVLKDRLERLPFAIKRALEEAREKKKLQKAEQALRESEERLRDILFSTADWVWEVNENGVFTYSSQQGLELLNATNDEIIGKTPFDFMPKEEAKRISSIFKQLVKDRAPIKDLENWNIDKNGEMICLLTNGVPIINEYGEFKGYRGVDKNITERKVAENAIRQSEAELNYAQEIGKMGSWHHHLPTKKHRWSKNMYHMLGLDIMDNDIAFLVYLNHIHPEDKSLIDLYLQKILQTRSGVSFELRYLKDNGEMIWLHNNIRPNFENEQLTELHGVITDITEKKNTELDLIKAKESAEASDRLKTAFMNNISHEIRTPLNGILGFTEVLADPTLAPRDKDMYTAMLYNSSERLINTVTNFLDISLLTSGNQRVVKKEMNLNLLLQQVMEKFKSLSAQKNLTMSLELPFDQDEVMIVSDKDLLEKILTQLTDNAIKFTTRGSVTVGCRINENELLFFVRDTGVGIHEHSRQQIFEYFMQENTASNRGYEGSGLGLTIARGFINLLGGRIWMESEKGKGSTFYFSIPLEQPRHSKHHRQAGRGAAGKRQKQTIVIAEDDDTNFFYISILLKSDSLTLLHAHNGTEAVELCNDHPETELVLMDLKMPEMDGFEATRLIKSQRKDLPVIAVSAYSGSEEQQRAIEAGCDEFITKPIKKELLLQKLEEFSIPVDGEV